MVASFLSLVWSHISGDQRPYLSHQDVLGLVVVFSLWVTGWSHIVQFFVVSFATTPLKITSS